MKRLLLQCKFLLVAWLNISYMLVPNPLRKYYLRLFGIKIGAGSSIHRCCKFFHVGGLTIGRNSVVNFGCYLDNRRGITIGDDVGLAHNVKIYTLGHNMDSPNFETKGSAVVIEDGAFVFANAMIMPGVTLHKNCIVLPGSVVTKDVEVNTVVGGNPAKFVRKRDFAAPPNAITIGLPSRQKGSEKMNILFVLKSYEMGGVEVVTSVLANKFVAEGHRVSIFAFAPAEKCSVEDRLDSRIHTYTLKHQRYCEENVSAMREVMKQEHTDVVINQWGLPFYPLKTVVKAARGMNVKFISVYHNTPDMNGRLQSVDNVLAVEQNPVKRCMLRGKRYIFKQITAYGMRWNYNHSHRFMVLSPSFISKFEQFTGVHHASKLIVQTNPVTIEMPSQKVDLSRKQKEVIYVGRIDEFQKRVDRIIHLWKEIEPSHQDWKLTIVGDGEKRKEMETLVDTLHLKNVSFEGFKNPVDYYKRASILLLTSDFEGFGLVIIEGMSYGVVPIVYGSYSAIYDIVDSGNDGVIVPPSPLNDYDASAMSTALQTMIDNRGQRETMAEAAITKSKRFSIDAISREWNQVFTSLRS